MWYIYIYIHTHWFILMRLKLNRKHLWWIDMCVNMVECYKHNFVMVLELGMVLVISMVDVGIKASQHFSYDFGIKKDVRDTKGWCVLLES